MDFKVIDASYEIDRIYTEKFHPRATFVESNPFKYGLPINCGRYYTGSTSSLIKRPIYDKIEEIVHSYESSIIVREVDVPGASYSVNKKAICIDGPQFNSLSFLKVREFSGSYIDLHFYDCRGTWSACLDSTEEVVVFCDLDYKQLQLISSLGGAESISAMILSDMEYLAHLPFWSDHQSVILKR